MNARAALAACISAAAIVLGACGEGDKAGNPDSEISVGEATTPLDGDAPPALRAIRREASELLGGGVDAFRRRLESLRGIPVVVNNWASWCGPCRAEFPHFQAQAMERGGEVAFLGIDSGDTDEAAETFLSELPLPYPSYADPDEDVRREFLDNPVALPATAFYDSRGELAHVFQGVYTETSQLAADIDRYAR